MHAGTRSKPGRGRPTLPPGTSPRTGSGPGNDHPTKSAPHHRDFAGAPVMAGSGTAQLRDGGALLRVENLVVEFPAAGGRRVHAVSDVSFDVLEGETLGLVGESGCGKSTTGRAVMQLPRPTSGRVRFEDRELTTLSGDELRRTRTRLQMIFQDPISSLNPRRRVSDIVAEPLAIWGLGTPSERRNRVVEVLDAV